MRFFNKQNDTMPRRRIYNNSKQPSTVPRNTFQRNRTITGSTSDNLSAAAHSIDSDLVSGRARTHHLVNRRRRAIGLLFFVIISVFLLWTIVFNLIAEPVAVLSLQSSLKPKQAESYQSSLQDYLNGNPIARVTFILDEKSITSAIQSSHPEVKQVRLGKTIDLGHVQFILTMRQPVAFWQINQTKIYVDADGVPFRQNYYNDPSVKIVDKTGVPLDTGVSAIASNKLLSFVGHTVDYSKRLGYDVTEAILPAGTTRRLDISLKNLPYFVKLSLDRPAGEQIEDMNSAVRYLISKNLAPTYIDVRVSGRAYYM